MQGLTYWSLSLTNLERTGYDAAKFFFESTEFVGYNTTNKEYVTRLYRTFMGREPEADGLNYWVGKLISGSSRESVLTSFARSDEFSQICATYAIIPGEI